jgi:hypothetical protein
MWLALAVEKFPKSHKFTAEAWTAFRGCVVRGGSWNNNPRNLRAAQRNRNTDENNNIGFRLASTLSAGAGATTVAPGVH